MSYQDWTPVVWNKGPDKKKAGSKEQLTSIARRAGEDVVTEKKFLGGQNKASKQACPNAAKLEEDTGDYRVDRVSYEFAKALQQARMKSNMTQAQLAQAINEKPSVINDYESGRAVPNGQVVQKLGRALGTQLPSAKPKK